MQRYYDEPGPGDARWKATELACWPVTWWEETPIYACCSESLPAKFVLTALLPQPQLTPVRQRMTLMLCLPLWCPALIRTMRL